MARLTGDPAVLYLPDTATEAMREQFREVNGFNDPILVQLYNYLLKRTAARFRHVASTEHVPAMDAVMDAFPWTLRLAGITVVLAMVVAMIVGPLAAYKPGSIFDRLASVLSLAAASMPDFWLAIIGILFFAVTLGILPTSGVGGPVYWILPIGVLMFRITGTTTQVVRGSMISSLASPYVKAAKAKGMPDNRILFVHALRNSADRRGDRCWRPDSRADKRCCHRGNRVRLAGGRQADDRCDRAAGLCRAAGRGAGDRSRDLPFEHRARSHLLGSRSEDRRADER